MHQIEEYGPRVSQIASAVLLATCINSAYYSMHIGVQVCDW